MYKELPELVFTFHYVSINTGLQGEKGEQGIPFTFHYVSINTHHSQPLILQT